MFGEKADYYQSLHAIRILSEAFWHLYWEVFERWASEEDIRQSKSPVEKVLKVLLDDTADATEQLQSIRASRVPATACDSAEPDACIPEISGRPSKCSILFELPRNV